MEARPMKKQRRTQSPPSTSTSLALELYIFVTEYSAMTHDTACELLESVMPDIDWESLAETEERRKGRIVNIYKAEDGIEEEDLWMIITMLPDASIAGRFEELVGRLLGKGYGDAIELLKLVPTLERVVPAGE
jgi:hypothetical protein